jgi:hypothetical protein
MAKVFGPTGLKGIDVTTESGVKKYDSDRSGFIEIDNPKHLAQAKSEGMVEVALFSGLAARKTYPCECGFNAIFVICGRCGKDNGSSDNADKASGEPTVSDS